MNKLTKDILAGKFEHTGKAGEIYVPGANIFIGGAFEHWVNDDLDGLEADGNLVVNEGLNYLLDVGLSNGTQKSNWYIGINKANYTFLATDTAANIATNSTEIIGADVDEVARPAWVEVGAVTESIGNTASPAVYTASGALTVYGAFLISTSAFGDGIASDRLVAAASFGTSRVLGATDVLNVTYTLNIADA